MKDFEFEEYNLEKIYLKLVSPSKPRTVRACNFFKQPNLIAPLQCKMAKVLAQRSNSVR